MMRSPLVAFVVGRALRWPPGVGVGPLAPAWRAKQPIDLRRCYHGCVPLDLFAALFEVTATLETAGVEHALAGGLALAVHGVPRATTDIDLLVLPDDLERALQAVRAVGFSFGALPIEFSDGMKLHRVTRISDGEAITLDLILVDDNLREVWKTKCEFETAHGRTLCVIDRAGLVAMKVRAGRAKDLADLERLRDLDR